ncbi:related to cell cycle control protein dicer [Ustilago bromivora]|uniref:Related to cell cycle control protein dicer n=1 Tax=Ustilago bromivora TaxID=307758 RepID=A0A8H8TRE9_9BASI|nr:related to cell cycle control protein dicer [Ustilago bromivora]
MAEKGNKEHAGAILNAFKTEANRAKWLDGIAEPHLAMRDWGEDWQQKLRIDADNQEGVGVEGGKEEECMFEPTTGARLFPEDAPTLVSHYATTLHSEYLKDAVLAYRIEKVDGLPSYKAVLELPSTAAVRSVESDGCRSKKAAKRMAAFRACQQLRALGELDEWLMPKLVPRLKKAKDGVVGLVNPHHQAWRGSGKPINVPSKKLDGWARFASSHHHATGQGWCATLLQLDKFDEGYEPLLLLTRGALPETKLLKLLHAGSGQMKDLHPKPLRIAAELDSELMGKVVEFTKFVFKLISRKDGHLPKGKRLSWQTIEKGQPTVLVLPVRIAAEEVQSVGDVALDFPPSLDLTQLDLNAEGSEQKLKGRTLVRQHGYHSHSLYQFESIRSGLCPNSPLSSGAAGETYLTQHMKMYARHQASADEHEVEVLAAQLANQPFLSVRKLPKISNLLSPPPSISFSATPAATQGARLIVPHFYALHPLPSTLLRSILLLPSIFTRYDQLLLAQACNNDLLEGRLDKDKVLEALTSPSAGSAFDYKRLEFLGDTFLKLVATCHTFTTHLGRTEAELHMANKGIVTNVRLLKEAKRLGLEKYAILPSCNLLPRRFTAPVIGSVGGALTNDSSMDHDGQVDVVKEKTLSDIVESLIGAALLSPSSSSPSSPSSTSTALFVCRILHLIPSTISTLSDFNKLLEELKHESVERNWSSRLNPPSLRHLQSLFSHTYRYPHLALESFTHPSLLASILPSYQRLGFLGDAWIDFFIVSRIYTEGGGLVVLDPGEMTALKGVLASNAALSALGVKLGLHKFIASNSAVLVESIAKYGKGLEKVLRKGGGEGQYWTKAGMVQVPKAVADVVEASFASIVVDSGFDQDTAQRVFGRIFTPFYDEHRKWEDLRVGEVKRVIDPILALNSSDDEEEEEMQTDQPSNLEQPDEEMPQANAAIPNHQDDQAGPTEALKPQTNQNWEDMIDYQEHLLLQLARTLGWKSTIQTPLTSPATAEEKEEVVMTLAKIRDLILPPPSSSSSSDSAK